MSRSYIFVTCHSQHHLYATYYNRFLKTLCDNFVINRSLQNKLMLQLGIPGPSSKFLIDTNKNNLIGGKQIVLPKQFIWEFLSLTFNKTFKDLKSAIFPIEMNVALNTLGELPFKWWIFTLTFFTTYFNEWLFICWKFWDSLSSINCKCCFLNELWNMSIKFDYHGM